MKKILTSFTAASVLALSIAAAPLTAMADAAPGDVVISLGENLTADQKQSVLNELQAPSNALTVTVSNKEEHEYLGNYIPATQIGTRALSSSKITITEKGTGLKVRTNHINWVTTDMYVNALATAGVKDAEVEVTAPFDVSGTAALTGIIKSYEASTGEKIPEEQKQVANEEMVTTAKLGENIGTENANNLVTSIKTELAKDMPKNESEMQTLVEDQANKLNIQLTDADKQKLTDLFMKMKDLDINWGAVGDQLGKMKDKVQNFINSEDGQNFLHQAGEFIKKVVQAIIDFFSGLFGNK